MLSTHTCVKKHNDSFTFSISRFLNIKNINTYNLLSDVQTLEPLIEHLSVHDILIMRMLSRPMAVTLSKFQKTSKKSELLLDSIKYDCYDCVLQIKSSYAYPSQNAKIFLECIKNKSFKTLKMLMNFRMDNLNGTIKMDYPKPTYILDGATNQDNFIYQCIIETRKHKPDDATILLEHITHHFKMTHIEMIYPICINANKNIFYNIFSKWELIANNGTVNAECMMLMLHNMCLYGMMSDIKHNIISVTDWRFLIELITVNKDIYENDIINILLTRMLVGRFPSVYMDDYIELVRECGNATLMRDIGNSSQISMEHKLKLVKKAYQLNISSHFTFLDVTQQWNILSINEAIENGGGTLYTSNLTLEQILSFIVSTDNPDIKEELIYLIKNEPYLSGIHKNNLELIAKWSADNDKIKCINHLINLQYLDINIKKILISKIYEKNIEANIKFLNDNEELNILSIEQADKYRSPEQEIRLGNCSFLKCHDGHYIYTNKLSLDTLFKLIFSVSNKK